MHCRGLSGSERATAVLQRRPGYAEASCMWERSVNSIIPLAIQSLSGDKVASLSLCCCLQDD